MSLELFVEHLTGKPGSANTDLFNRLVAILQPRRREALLLHFRDGPPYKAVGERMGGITATRAMQLAERGVRDIRERIAMDTGLSLPFDKRSETLRTVIVGTVEGYDALILAKQQRRVEAEARALERHRTDSIDTLMLTQPTQRALAKAGIVTVGELVAMTEADLRSLGRVNIANIISRLDRLGLGLATTKDTH
jgi:hypothetical protein